MDILEVESAVANVAENFATNLALSTGTIWKLDQCFTEGEEFSIALCKGRNRTVNFQRAEDIRTGECKRSLRLEVDNLLANSWASGHLPRHLTTGEEDNMYRGRHSKSVRAPESHEFVSPSKWRTFFIFFYSVTMIPSNTLTNH